MNWGVGIDTYRLLRMKQTTDGNVGLSTGGSAQRSV